jgi:hypothetical protein
MGHIFDRAKKFEGLSKWEAFQNRDSVSKLGDRMRHRTVHATCAEADRAVRYYCGICILQSKLMYRDANIAVRLTETDDRNLP